MHFRLTPNYHCGLVFSITSGEMQAACQHRASKLFAVAHFSVVKCLARYSHRREADKGGCSMSSNNEIINRGFTSISSTLLRNSAHLLPQHLNCSRLMGAERIEHPQYSQKCERTEFPEPLRFSRDSFSTSTSLGSAVSFESQSRFGLKFVAAAPRR